MNMATDCLIHVNLQRPEAHEKYVDDVNTSNASHENQQASHSKLIYIDDQNLKIAETWKTAVVDFALHKPQWQALSEL